MESKNQPKSGEFVNQKGQHIFYRNWLPGTEPKAIVLIVHGLNSHSGYYQHFAAQLLSEDFEIYALDLAGRGRSEGERYYIADYRDVLADIDLLLEIARSASPSTPTFLFGHSAGGVFASAYAIQNQAKLQGLITESFAFQIPAPAIALAAIKLLAHLIPHTRLVKLNNEDFSRDQSFLLKMAQDPLLENEKQPAKTMQQLLLAGEYLKKGMPLIRLPLLILHGTADKATMPSGSQYFLDHAASADKVLKLYDGHYHDLLNDKFKELVIKEIINWLNKRI